MLNICKLDFHSTYDILPTTYFFHLFTMCQRRSASCHFPKLYFTIITFLHISKTAMPTKSIWNAASSILTFNVNNLYANMQYTGITYEKI